MRKITAIFFAILSLTSCSTVQDNERQTNIDSIFDKMELQGVDIQKPLLYGFYFYDQDQSKLEKLKDELLKDKYKLVRLEKAEDQEFVLHVEKVEIHSRASLLERENQLEQLSKTFQVASYDGWDVGNPDPTKPLVSKDDGFEKSLVNKSAAELYKMANDLYNSKSHNEAVVVFQKCIESNYKLDTCYYKQGVSYLGLGQAKVGIEKFEAALKINPKYVKACFNIGATCYDNEEYQKSIDYYQKAAKLDPKDDRVYYGIAAAQFVLGHLKAAEENCQIALKLNPGNENAKALLGDMKKE
ncbi:ribonuclease E inhibitor RraB [Haliscomenobacter hydrossis]|uniref:Tetratricopeptide TPR_1 repeat-containing protein n=1 Tax=Haliscomenobacter hydrossis (strain ATCC 27775 / DSM 1100 / LMG 10767 / O) TaxID=760192 RepID=F4KS54_HALH1|nr:ribonuclease E inhibitor RraB [Haliscomenobacter hydrossis]AEE52299.1 Tetratricopeptide TPR_1 repeat-containing protein [Haliscomenobacter hydrossis DSM 1100]